MYLLTIAVEEEAGHIGPLGLKDLGNRLGVSGASVNEMVKKLGQRDLVHYKPYHGVELTEDGRQVARRVLRTRRLWVTFLSDRLGVTPLDADDLACQLEHVTPPAIVARLDEFLGLPEFDPFGRSIPEASTTVVSVGSRRLTDCEVGTELEVVAVDGAAVFRFLHGEGVDIGSTIRITGMGPRSVILDTRDGPIHLERGMAQLVAARPRS